MQRVLNASGSSKVIAAQAQRNRHLRRRRRLVGNFKNGGADYGPKGNPLRVNVYPEPTPPACSLRLGTFEPGDGPIEWHSGSSGGGQPPRCSDAESWFAFRLRGSTVRKRLASGEIKTYCYYRAAGRPLTGEPGTAEFITSYGEAEKAMRDRHTGATFNALIRGYAFSIEFEQKLRPARRQSTGACSKPRKSSSGTCRSRRSTTRA
jgi:hypothetical protein